MSLKYRMKEFFGKLIFIGPSLVGLLIFYIIPFIWMIFFSFLDNPINKRFIGFANYIDLINNDIYKLAVNNTIVFTLISVPIIVVLSLIIALILSKGVYFQEKIEASLIIPLVVPVASVIMFFDLIFDYYGVLNKLLSLFNVEAINWKDSPYSLLIIILMYIWKNLGYNIILFLAGLSTIPKSYYELASVEGGNSLQKFFKITIVYLSPTTFFVIVISIINSFKVFKEVYLLSGNYPHQRIYMLQHYMNNMFSKLEYTKLVTSAILMAIVVYILVYILFRVQNKINEDIKG